MARPSRRRRGTGRGAGPKAKRGRGCLVLLGLLALVLGIAFLLRSLLLAWLAAPLVAQSTSAAAGVAAIVDGEGRYVEAARLASEGAVGKILIIEGRPNRLERAGLLPSSPELARRELQRHGGSSVEIEVLRAAGGASANDWTWARALDGWMQSEPEVSVLVLCKELQSRYVEKVVEEVLGERAIRVSFRPLADRRFDRSNWWRSEAGVKGFFSGYASLLHLWLVGDGGVTGEQWEPGPWVAAQPGGRPPLEEAPPEQPAQSEEAPVAPEEGGP